MNIPLLREAVRRNAVVSRSRSGGPGGQHVNKVNTKVVLRLALDALEGLSPEEGMRLRHVLQGRLTGAGELIAGSQEERSQGINLERAFARLEALIIAAARLPKRRKPSKPSLAAQEKRLQAKRQGSLKKARRCFVLDAPNDD